jgi:hypothetical protein
MGVSGIPLRQDGVKKLGCLLIDAKRLGLKDDLNQTMRNRKQKINGGDPRKSNTLPKELQFRAKDLHNRNLIKGTESFSS